MEYLYINGSSCAIFLFVYYAIVHYRNVLLTLGTGLESFCVSDRTVQPMNDTPFGFEFPVKNEFVRTVLCFAVARAEAGMFIFFLGGGYIHIHIHVLPDRCFFFNLNLI